MVTPAAGNAAVGVMVDTISHSTRGTSSRTAARPAGRTFGWWTTTSGRYSITARAAERRSVAIIGATVDR